MKRHGIYSYYYPLPVKRVESYCFHSTKILPRSGVDVSDGSRSKNFDLGRVMFLLLGLDQSPLGLKNCPLKMLNFSIFLVRVIKISTGQSRVSPLFIVGQTYAQVVSWPISKTVRWWLYLCPNVPSIYSHSFEAREVFPNKFFPIALFLNTFSRM